MQVNMKFPKDPTFKKPVYATAGAGAMDIHAWNEKTIVLDPGDTIAVETGIQMEVPEGWVMDIRARSGLALKNSLGILNAPGTIDSDYRGEVKVICHNHGKVPIPIERGMRIAQMLLVEAPRVQIVEVDDVSATARGAGGFGHTGTGPQTKN